MNAAPALRGRNVLVLEDNYLLAEEERWALENAGARVIGPFSTMEAAMEALQRGAIDCALIDINLGSGPDFELAGALRKQGVPIVFVTGYDASVIPEEFLNVPRLEKPFAEADVVSTVARICAAGARPSGT